MRLLRHFLQKLWRPLIVTSLIGLTLWTAYRHMGCPPLGVDDAHIFFVYGQSLDAGEGLVYNAGGERVEGFTSPLWMLMVAAAFALFKRPEIWLLVANVLMTIVTVTALWRFVDKGERLTSCGVLLLVWVFGSPSYVIWMTLTLMDTTIWSSLLVLTTVMALSNSSPRYLAVLVSLLLLTRPEALLWSLVMISIFGFFSAKPKNLFDLWQRLRLPLFAYGVTIAALLAFRLAYFGYPLPNTYYAKVSPNLFYNLQEGTKYLLAFLYDNRQMIVSLGPMVAGVALNLPCFLGNLTRPDAKLFDRTKSSYLALSLVCLVGLVVPLMVGGDHFALYRLYQPLWPLFVLPLFYMSDILDLDLGHIVRYGLTLVISVAFLALPVINWANPDYLYNRFSFEFTHAAEGEAIGETLNRLFEDPLPSVGAIKVGGIAFAYEGMIVDMMGLNNLAMAHTWGSREGMKNHAAFNGDVLLSQRPDLLLPTMGTPDGLHAQLEEWCVWRNSILRGFLREERFLNAYQLTILSRSGDHILAYVEREYLGTLKQSVVTKVVECPWNEGD